MRPLSALRQRLRARAAVWIRRRQGADTLPVAIGQRRVYILPTRAGLCFGLLLFVMLLAGLNYGNGLALLLTFTLGGLMLVAMHQCHRNLLGTVVSRVEAGNVFAGEQALIHCVLGNEGTPLRYALRLSLEGGVASVADLQPGGQAILELRLPAPRRGRLQVARLRLDTRFPFGLFEAWTWLHPSLEILVYPTPRGTTLPAQRAAASSGTQRLQSPGADEWSSLRTFRAGDSPRRVAWTAYARGAPLLVKEYSSAASARHHFSYASLVGMAPEARLEQLCRWVIDATQRGERFVLELPGSTVTPENSLRALALFGEP